MSVKCVLQDQIKSTFTQEDADNRYIQITEKGSANGVATLGSGGKIPGSQLPDMNYVPLTRKVNGKALSTDITLTAEDIGALPDTWAPDPEDIDAYTKQQTLSSSTKLLYGQETDAVPDDILEMLSNSLKVEKALVPKSSIFENWTASTDVTNIGSNYIIGTDGISKIIVAGGSTIFGSSDAGETWSTKDIGSSTFVAFVNGKVFTRQSYSLSVSDDLGNTFTSCNLSNALMYSPTVITYQDNLYVGTSTDTNNVSYWYSTDGISWVLASTGNTKGTNGLYRINGYWWATDLHYIYYSSGDIKSSTKITWDQVSSIAYSDSQPAIFPYGGYIYIITSDNTSASSSINRMQSPTGSIENIFTCSHIIGSQDRIQIYDDLIILCHSSEDGNEFFVSNDGLNFDEYAGPGFMPNVKVCGDKAFCTTYGTAPLHISNPEYVFDYALLTPSNKNKTSEVAQALDLTGMSSYDLLYHVENTTNNYITFELPEEYQRFQIICYRTTSTVYFRSVNIAFLSSSQNGPTGATNHSYVCQTPGASSLVSTTEQGYIPIFPYYSSSSYYFRTSVTDLIYSPDNSTINVFSHCSTTGKKAPAFVMGYWSSDNNAYRKIGFCVQGTSSSTITYPNGLIVDIYGVK